MSADKPAEPVQEPAALAKEAPAEEAAPLRSVHTSNFPQLLEQFGISLLVSTYQAGKLIIVRADGGKLNTHFRNFKKPMGLATDGRRLVLGTAQHVWEFRNLPAVARKLDRHGRLPGEQPEEPPGNHDACFLPSQVHVTGDIDVHEMALAGQEVWLVNTRFSCLCTLDHEHSFVPRWRPPFVTALAPEDRCHLNGLALEGGQPRYVTTHAQTDTRQGWREHKAKGGALIDVASSATIAASLAMPHSPRWHDGRLWLLESGAGTLAVVDPHSGRLQTIAELPGFTRGLDFHGPLAFVGLSQVRESAIFSGIPITERLTERTCGVWVVHVPSRQTVAFVRFEGAVQEIFAVAVLHGIRYPELITDDDKVIGSSYVLPEEALKAVPGQVKSKK